VYLTPEIRLTGVLDKIEFVDSTSDIIVIDYKTGGAKSRNEIMGKNKDADGNYYRQLVFYKLLLRYFQEGKYTMMAGELDFIEPDAKGKLHKERFEISDEEVDELEATIKRVADEIMNLSFWDTPCDPEVCDYCDIVDMIKGYLLTPPPTLSPSSQMMQHHK
jgi:DNA helicase-2/ATP-dependent DNA helicase PcrA